MSRRACAAAAVAALAALAACEHARPFAAYVEPNVPFDSTYPRRLTFSTSGDVEPAWLPGDSGIIYALSSGEPNQDQCLGVLPPGGGHLVRIVCHDLADPDSTVLLRAPAVGAGGRLAYLRERSVVGAAAPAAIELVVATLADPDPGHAVLRFPYTDAGGTLHGSAGSLRWLPGGDLVYIAEQLTFATPPQPPDTIATPLWIERLTPAGDTATIAVVPGSAGATSLAVDSAGALYFTLPGDSVVYRVAPGAASPSSWYVLGGIGALSGVQVHGNLLVAVGDTNLYVVDVAAHTRVRVTPPDSLRLARPALSPSGTRLVVEAARPGLFPDLWLYQAP
ncbi:MAG TPA: hypothetical protein VEH62_14600 [Gemmatimonadales bacterium]|nr:hypothetical protein [Gemmatimonadales bacterium]